MGTKKFIIELLVTAKGKEGGREGRKRGVREGGRKEGRKEEGKEGREEGRKEGRKILLSRFACLFQTTLMVCSRVSLN